MKIVRFSTLAVLVSALSVVAIAQSTQQKQVLGYQDSQTGQFHPLVHEVPDATTTSPTTGTLKVTLDITVKSIWPNGVTPTYICSASWDQESVNLSTDSVTTHDEQASSKATVSGTTGSCVVTIPYSWILPAASPTVTSTVTGSYVVYVYSGYDTATQMELRMSAADFFYGAVPATGTTTSKTINVTL